MSRLTATQASDSPWHFLDALGFDSDADQQLVRLTRDGELGELHIVTNLVRSSKASILYAYSGNGKSSLINAGLIPNMLAAKYVVFRTRPRPPFATKSPEEAFKACMLREVWVPELDPANQTLPKELLQEMANIPGPRTGRLTAILERIESQWGRVNNSRSLRASYLKYMRSKMHLPLREFIAATQTFFGSGQYLLFVCDQFEELFVHYLNQPALQTFVTQVGEIVADSKLHAQFLFSMREDWVGSMLQLRENIPEVLLNMYQLLPLRRSAAAPVLEFPLSRLDLKFDEGVVDRILADLSDFYSVLQRHQQYTAVNLTRSPEKDPYLELPALQVVADKLWETRGSVPAPFSLAHYVQLPKLLSAAEPPSTPPANHGKPIDSRSPVQQLLEEYLPQMLDRISRDEQSSSVINLRDLRIDILYALTDRKVHRRALPGPKLLSECQRAQTASLDAALTEEDFRQALEPLIKVRLVRTALGRGSEREYELAHDFLVRSVASLWESLDRQRAASRALARQTRLEMEKGQRRFHLSMVWLPFFALFAVMLSGIAADRQRQESRGVLRSTEGAIESALDGIVRDAATLPMRFDQRGFVIPKEAWSPVPFRSRDLRLEGSLYPASKVDRDGNLIIRVSPSYVAPPEVGQLLPVIRKRPLPNDLIVYSEWPHFLDLKSTDSNIVELQKSCRSFDQQARSLQRSDYSWTLIAPILIGLLLWLAARLARNGPGQLTGFVTVVGCLALAAVSAVGGLNWDGQWGWRTVLAFTQVPLWLVTAAFASVRLWPTSSAPYRWRVLSAHAIELTPMYWIAVLPLLAQRSLGTDRELWIRYIPQSGSVLAIGFLISIAVQSLLRFGTGSTLGCLLTGLRMVSKKSPTAPIGALPILVSEAIRWAEFLLVFLLIETYATNAGAPPSDILFLTFCSPLIIYGSLCAVLLRPLEDRLVGIDYTPESVAAPDFSAFRKLFSLLGIEYRPPTRNRSGASSISAKPPV